MAAHDTPEFSTATGNDYPSHEETYRTFTFLILVIIMHVVSICLGLTIGGVKDNWWAGGGLILVATLAAVISLTTGTKMPSYVVVVLGFLGLALA